MHVVHTMRHVNAIPKDLKGKVKSGLGNRGNAEYRQDGNLVVTLWQDTKTVSVLSTNCQPHSEIPVSRRQKNEATQRT